MWQPDDKISLYASYSRSFLPQVFTDRFNTVPPPERSVAYEVGFKRLVLDGRGSITGSLYTIRQSGLIAFDPDNLDVLLNAGEGRSRGFELEFDLRPNDDWTFAGGVALTDAEVVKSDIAEPGDTLPGAARWTATFFGKYAFGGGLDGLSANLGANYVSSAPWVQPPREPDLPSFVKLDLGVEYQLPRGLEFRTTVENLLNERIVLANGFGLTGPGSPRAVLLTLAWRGGSLAR